MQTAAAWNVDEQNYYFALVGMWWVCLQSRMYCNCRPTLYFQQVHLCCYSVFYIFCLLTLTFLTIKTFHLLISHH